MGSEGSMGSLGSKVSSESEGNLGCEARLRSERSLGSWSLMNEGSLRRLGSEEREEILESRGV